MRITQKPQVGGLDLYQVSTKVLTTDLSLFSTCVGEKFDVDGGESEVALVYTTTGLASGVLVQAPAIVVADQDLAVLTYSQPAPISGISGPATATVTLGASWTNNQYQSGYAFVTAGTGAGQKLKLINNSVTAYPGTGTLTFEDTPSVALDNTSKLSLTPNPYNNVIINPVTPTNKPIGITFYVIPALSFGLIGTKGSFACLNDGGTTIGLALAPSQSVAGAVKTGATTLDSIGRAQYTGVTTEKSIGSFNL
jgi:hypothetical protein